jgi:hypothetical protein
MNNENLSTLPDMTFDEAQAKHNELKSLQSAIRLLLLEMRDRKGWKALGFESWEQYGELEWGYSRQHLNRLATSAQIQAVVEPMGSSCDEIPERTLRPLTSVPDDVKIEIWQQVKSEHEKITAKVVQDAVDDWKAKNVGEQKVKTSHTVADLTESKTISSNEFHDEYAKEWGSFILEHSNIITAEQKKTANAQRKFKKLKAEQANLVQQAVEKTLTNVVVQMMLMNSFLAEV